MAITIAAKTLPCFRLDRAQLEEEGLAGKEAGAGEEAEKTGIQKTGIILTQTGLATLQTKPWIMQTTKVTLHLFLIFIFLLCLFVSEKIKDFLINFTNEVEPFKYIRLMVND